MSLPPRELLKERRKHHAYTALPQLLPVADFNQPMRHRRPPEQDDLASRVPVRVTDGSRRCRWSSTSAGHRPCSSGPTATTSQTIPITRQGALCPRPQTAPADRRYHQPPAEAVLCRDWLGPEMVRNHRCGLGRQGLLAADGRRDRADHPVVTRRGDAHRNPGDRHPHQRDHLRGAHRSEGTVVPHTCHRRQRPAIPRSLGCMSPFSAAAPADATVQAR